MPSWPAELTMPKLSDSEADIVIIRWLKTPGEGFRRGEALMEVETDKATVVYEAEDDGTLEAILVSEGESAAVGQPIARLAGDGSAAPAEERPAPGLRRTARLPPARARTRPRSRAGPRSSSASRSMTSPGPGPAAGSRARTSSVRRRRAPARPARRCARGCHRRRADADAGDHRAPHGAVGRGDPDLHRLCRRRRVAGRRASPRSARGVATPHPRSTISW